MNKLLAALRFIFRKRLTLSTEVINTGVKNYSFTIVQRDAENFQSVVCNSQIAAEVHPLYLCKVSWHIVKNLNQYLEKTIDSKLLKMLVHLSNHFEYFGGLKVNREYLVKSQLCLIEPHKKGVRIALRFEYYDQEKLVAIEHTVGLLYGVKCQGERKQIGKMPIKNKEKEAMIWQQTLPIDKSLPYQYANKADIDAPIHTQPKFARSIGLPNIILQGTCTFAQAVSLILEHRKNSRYCSVSQTDNIKRLSVNFTGMLFVPNEITIRVVYQTENKIVFDVLDKNGRAVIKGGNIIFREYELGTILG